MIIGSEVAAKGQPKPKYLIVGRDKHITLYLLPLFEKVSKAELKIDNHYEWIDHFAVKDVDGNGKKVKFIYSYEFISCSGSMKIN
jgi:hypothetical protein